MEEDRPRPSRVDHPGIDTQESEAAGPGSPRSALDDETAAVAGAEVGTEAEGSPVKPPKTEKPSQGEKPPKAKKKPPKRRKPKRPRRHAAASVKRLRSSGHRGRVLVSAVLRRPSYGSTVEYLPSRSELPILLNRRGLVGTGAAVGAKKGSFSKAILRAWEGERLISIDTWHGAERDEQRARELLSGYGERSEIWRLTSVEAAKRVDSHTLDFVFVDGRRDYDAVLEDLETWFDKVRPGGVVAGPDYVDGEFPEGLFEVKRAVDEFFAARELEVHPSTQPDPDFPTWFVEIPARANDDGRPRDAEPAESSASGS